MFDNHQMEALDRKYIITGSHSRSDYFSLVRELVGRRDRYEKGCEEYRTWQEQVDRVYALISEELVNNHGRPTTEVKFGTSGWRGIIGKDIYVKSVGQVTRAIVALYHEAEKDAELAAALGVGSLAEARSRGCIVGFDNRFGGELLAKRVCDVLTDSSIPVYYAAETTTGVVSAALLQKNGAFSINLTPSHNPLEYGGYKFNGSDGGPASALITNWITRKSREIIEDDREVRLKPDNSLVRPLDSLECWKDMVRKNLPRHRLDYEAITKKFAGDDQVVLAIDCVHGASRLHVTRLFGPGTGQASSGRLLVLRGESDPTFGGIAPEPSSTNMAPVIQSLAARSEQLKIGALIDPDGDRVRFTDGKIEIDMNLFGAMAYHFLHEHKGLSGMVAKTVATSNFANRLAHDFGEEVYESRVGFKEFKPVVDRALVCFEESDGISVIGHTPEKDAYIGVLLALDMAMTLRMNLGEYLTEIQGKHGFYFPAKDGVSVKSQGRELMAVLARLEKFGVGSKLMVGNEEKTVEKIIDIDGWKMVFDDGSWLMVRPSGTEPKVRFYVEARNREQQVALFDTARGLLAEIGLL